MAEIAPVHTWAFQQFLLKQGTASTVLDSMQNDYEKVPARDPVPYCEMNCARQRERPADPQRDEEKLRGYAALREERAQV